MQEAGGGCQLPWGEETQVTVPLPDVVNAQDLGQEGASLPEPPSVARSGSEVHAFVGLTVGRKTLEGPWIARRSN